MLDGRRKRDLWKRVAEHRHGLVAALLTAAFALAPIAASATPVSVGAGESLIVHFDIAAGTTSSLGLDIDTVTFALVLVADPTVKVTVELLSGPTVFGSSGPVAAGQIAAFSDGVWTENVAVVDLSALRSGAAFSGRLRITPDFSMSSSTTLDATVSPVTSLVIGHATGANSIDPAPITLGNIVVVPEPTVPALASLAALALCGVRRPS